MLFVSALCFITSIRVEVAHATAPNPSWWIDNNSSFSQYDDYQYKNGRTHQGTYYQGTIAQLSPTPGVDSNILSTNASYDGVAAVGPRWGDQGVSDIYTYFTSDNQATQEDEWQCAELVKRFLFLEYGTRSLAANGYQVVDTYYSAYPTMYKKVANDSTNTTNQIYPKPGDILSYNQVVNGQGIGDGGHTALVKSVTNQSGGSATVQLIEQNSSASGVFNQTFSNWQFQNGRDDDPTDTGHTVSGWLTTTAAHLTWTNQGNISYTQYGHQAVLLDDGNVLTSGGIYSNFSTNHTMMFTDGTPGTWASKANMIKSRKYFGPLQLVTISGGGRRVLAASGVSDSCSCVTNTAELYNESSNSWTATGTNMNQARWYYASSVLSDGRVLVTGGNTDANGNNQTASTEIYDPVADTWTTKASMSTARQAHQQVTFTDSNGNSKVMVIGGSKAGTGILSSTEIYNPSANTWSAGPSLSYARNQFAAVLMYDGRILVVGGDSTSTHSEVYNPATNSWTTYTTPYTAYNWTPAVVLGGGANYRVLAAGGTSSGTTHAMWFDPSANSWSTSTSMNTARALFTLTTLSNGNVLATGGQNGSFPGGLSSSEKFAP